MEEAMITINGAPINGACSMAIRLACSSFFDELSSDPDALGSDEMGRRLASAYKDRLSEVLKLIISPQRSIKTEA